jgi:formate dehydrogenase subunit delta
MRELFLEFAPGEHRVGFRILARQMVRFPDSPFLTDSRPRFLMDIAHLCRMANQISQFYRTLPDRNEALLSTATHLRRFWDPRMRRQLLEHIDERGGAGLDQMVLDAVAAHRASLSPPPVGSSAQ